MQAGSLANQDMTVRFWGVRGSIPCPGEANAGYGGNTSCVEVRCGPHRLVFDAGTGLYELGVEQDHTVTVDLDLFLTHTHYDHVWGWPHFMPLLDRHNKVRVHAGHLDEGGRIEAIMLGLIDDPLNLVNRKTLAAAVSFHDFTIGEVLEPRPGVRIRTAPLVHPNRAVGYRVEYQGRVVCYVTDTEHKKDGLDQNILRLIEGADIMIYDATYTDEEYPKFVGWGHSTWQEGARLCQEAKVKTYVVFHHDPSHDDAFMDRVQAAVSAERPGSIVAREGLVLRP